MSGLDSSSAYLTFESKKELKANIQDAILLTLVHMAFGMFLKPGLLLFTLIMEIM